MFRGDFDLTAAGAVCSQDPQPVARELVGSSLWSSVPTADRRTRYRQLEPIRQFTYSRLLNSPACPDVHVRHAEYFIDLAYLTGGMRRVDDADNVSANLTAAYEWCRTERRDDLAARIATAMLSVSTMMPSMAIGTPPADEPEGGQR